MNIQNQSLPDVEHVTFTINSKDCNYSKMEIWFANGKPKYIVCLDYDLQYSGQKVDEYVWSHVIRELNKGGFLIFGWSVDFYRDEKQKLIWAELNKVIE